MAAELANTDNGQTVKNPTFGRCEGCTFPEGEHCKIIKHFVEAAEPGWQVLGFPCPHLFGSRVMITGDGGLFGPFGEKPPEDHAKLNGPPRRIHW
jgi:hypothetical protein